MDNLKTLVNKRQYELVIKLTNTAKDKEALFCRILSFLALNEPLKALEVINSNQKELEQDLAIIAKPHIDILCLLKRYDEAYEVANHYKSLPYQSQVVEEILSSLTDVIKEYEKEDLDRKYVSSEEIEKLLQSENDDDIFYAATLLKERDILPFLPFIKSILINNKDQLIRSYMLLLLVDKEVNREIKFNSDGQIITLNPQKLNPPFNDEVFSLMMKKINNTVKDITLVDLMTQMYSTYILYYYPNPVKKEEISPIFAALYLVCREMIQNPVNDIDSYLKEVDVSKEDLNIYLTRLNKSAPNK